MSSEWPKGLPRNFDELAAQYGEYIAKQVERYNKVDRNFEDLFQAIWVKLMESDILNKFATKVRAALPPTMTTEEACAYLGIPFTEWPAIVEASEAVKGDQPRIPVPMGGFSCSRNAVVRTADVVRFDKSGYIRKRKFPQCCKAKDFGETMSAEEACVFWGVNFRWFWKNLMRAAKRELAEGRTPSLFPYPLKSVSGKLPSPKCMVLTKDIKALDGSGFLGERSLPRRRPKPSARGFKSYLSRAIHNHFANFCRTNSRRNKEHVLPPTTIIGTTSSGYCYAGKSETGTAWEGALVEAMISPEDVIDVVSQIRKAKVDPNTERGIEVLDFVAQGYTIREALRMQQKTTSKVRVRVHHHG
jgi:DNA-directed RNA polymerase specialized sigma24 family protein